MQPLPAPVLALLATLPEETCKIVLNTNRRGHWEIEVFTRYQLDVPGEAGASDWQPSPHSWPSLTEP